MSLDDAWAPLREAVPSFAERWAACRARPWHDPDDGGNVSDLAVHLAGEVAEGRSRELVPFFATLDGLLAGADEALYNLLVIGLLEDLAHEAERRGVALSALEPAIAGPHARQAWGAVLRYLHPDAPPPFRP